MSRSSDAEPREGAERVGRTLRQKWHLDALIDVGGMAAVYAATHRNGMRGAVKILHAEIARCEDLARRFRREGYIANKIGHPGALRVIDDDVDDDGRPFLVMELLEGATLYEWAAARGGRLPAEQVLLVTDQLLDVLVAAHERGIIHRDVKPENLFLTRDGHVKVLDFGIARLSEAKEPSPSTTSAGVPMGSPGFMSPEQARGRWDLVDVQSDVWSVGATMFTLLSGEYVHVEDTLPELLAATFTKPARSLATVLPDAPPALVALVDRALRTRLADRWPDARSMQEALRATLPGVRVARVGGAAPALSGHERVPSREVATRRRPRARAPWVARALGLACVAVAIGVSARARDERPAAGTPPAASSAVIRTPAPFAVSTPVASDRAPDPARLEPDGVMCPPPRRASTSTTPRAAGPSTNPLRTMFDRRH